MLCGAPVDKVEVDTDRVEASVKKPPAQSRGRHACLRSVKFIH